MPEFNREYVVDLGDGFRLEIEIGYWALGRNDFSELRQGNGKRISFDLDAIADEIVDRELYPRVQLAVDEILAIDDAFRASKPSEFTDEKGVTWRRC